MEISLSVLRISYMETDKPDDITDKICDFQSERKESFSSYGRQNELSLQQYLNDI